MNKKRIWLSSPHMSGNELKYVNEAFKGNWVAPLGPNVDNFEKELGEYLNIKHVAVLNSGTAAIYLALTILGVENGDEVIASSFTFVATINPITYIGAIPVLIDSEPETWNMCPIMLKKTIDDRISKGKKPKAIILVHLYGMPSNIDEIISIATKYDIPVIEDVAEALGSRYKDRAVGTDGVLNILSFNGNKIITTSGGGALVSDNQEYIDKARFLSTQARDDAPHYQHSQIGFNFRMSNILAGIGRGQLEVIDTRVMQRKKNYKFYYENLSDIKGITFLDEPEGYFSNRWLTTILIDPEKTSGITREDVRLALEKENIESRPLWKPMHLQPVFKKYPNYTNGVSERLFEIGLCLPSGSNLLKNDKDRILTEVLKVFSS